MRTGTFIRTLAGASLAGTLLLSLGACEDGTETADSTTSEIRSPDNQLDITVFDYAFAAPGEIPSGWIELSVKNERAEEIHEVTLVRLPDGVSFREYHGEFIGAWEAIWEKWKAGEVTKENLGQFTAELLPHWSGELEYRHARGLLSPGHEAENTIHLPPGRYALECWVKNADGVIHISHGMIRELLVRDQDGGGQPPTGGIAVRVDREGIHMPESVSTGAQRFAVEVEAREDGTPVHGDLHLVRMADDTDLSEVVTWLDWYRIGGLQSPAPATFLGGYSTYGSPLHGGTAYFTLNIDEPGEYAWVIQDDPATKPWKVFTVD